MKISKNDLVLLPNALPLLCSIGIVMKVAGSVSVYYGLKTESFNQDKLERIGKFIKVTKSEQERLRLLDAVMFTDMNKQVRVGVIWSAECRDSSTRMFNYKVVCNNEVISIASCDIKMIAQVNDINVLKDMLYDTEVISRLAKKALTV